MPVKFNITPRKDPRDQTLPPKYYARVKSSGRTDTHAVARRINSMSTVSSVDTRAVLEAFLQVVPDELAEGNIVELGDFGRFRVSVSSDGEEHAEDVSARNITDVRVIFSPGRRFAQLLNTVQFQKETTD